ncbi:MAG: Sua5/YciO/YrdC/YwlC family protein, partial [Alphaproteobacteria bacterium]|nr:Sua5/YciO/YrdC/YwlC family protein [Alphaproteobacteria bacterium]
MKKIVEKSMLGQAWVLPTYSDDNFPGADDLVLKILKVRGIENADRFLNPSIKEYMPDPSVLYDMDNAARIIADAVVAGDKIAIYGDYDVDGITSTAVFVKYMCQIGADVIWHLPTREGEGYGLNTVAVQEIADAGAKLLITVDCGISGNEEVDFAKQCGVRVVVTDHHSPDAILPNADAVVNPKRSDDVSGLDYLAGVGVAFLTVVAVNRELKSRDLPADVKEKIDSLNLMNFMDLVALGTICDTMPLVGLNRAFVATGLKVMGLRQNLGLRVLMDVAGIKKPSVYAAGFALGPRLIAAGRLDSAAPALELLLTDNPLIAHIADIDMLRPLVKEIPEVAEKLMEAYWPGPMTLIFNKSELVPKGTTGGLDTVAVRYPNHIIAQAVIKSAGVSIAAPSANLSGKPSPTLGEHVIDD